MNIVVTGSKGFIGQHLVEALRRREGTTVIEFHRGSPPEAFESALSQADVVFHAAGTNRPNDPSEFATGNKGLTSDICSTLARLHKKPLLIFTSSTQAAFDNPYGVSKREAEDAIREWSTKTESPAVIIRVRNVFGKWCRPNYNSVIATFCHNIAHDLPIQVSDPTRELELIYIDDLIEGLLGVIANPPPGGRCEMREIPKHFKATLGQIAQTIRAFRDSRKTLVMPSFADEFTRALYATYLSYLDAPDFAYSLDQKTDNRGSLAEFMKSNHFGQIFVSRTKPGITRGNHYHHTKTEKFMVVEGEALIRFRQISGSGIIEHKVSGQDYRVVDIPPGYTHSIENTGSGELVTLFWASETFDPQRPDTYFLPVQKS